MSIVLPGVLEVFARFFRSVSMLISEDLPTLLRPMKAYSGKEVCGHISALGLDVTKVAEFIFIGFFFLMVVMPIRSVRASAFLFRRVLRSAGGDVC